MFGESWADRLRHAAAYHPDPPHSLPNGLGQPPSGASPKALRPTTPPDAPIITVLLPIRRRNSSGAEPSLFYTSSLPAFCGVVALGGSAPKPPRFIALWPDGTRPDCRAGCFDLPGRDARPFPPPRDATQRISRAHCSHRGPHVPFGTKAQNLGVWGGAPAEPVCVEQRGQSPQTPEVHRFLA